MLVSTRRTGVIYDMIWCYDMIYLLTAVG